jgi:hypothetical protein
MDPGSHVGFQISTKNTTLVEDNPMNISGKFGWNLFSGFREEDLNVKSWWTNGRTDAYPWQKLTWPMARWAKKKRSHTVVYIFLCYKVYHIKLCIVQLFCYKVYHIKLCIVYSFFATKYTILSCVVYSFFAKINRLHTSITISYLWKWKKIGFILHQ